jgi:hypothetical protein
MWAQGMALNIVEECEQSFLLLNDNNEVSFDFVTMHRQLLGRISNLIDVENVELIREEALGLIGEFCCNNSELQRKFLYFQ